MATCVGRGKDNRCEYRFYAIYMEISRTVVRKAEYRMLLGIAYGVKSLLLCSGELRTSTEALVTISLLTRSASFPACRAHPILLIYTFRA